MATDAQLIERLTGEDGDEPLRALYRAHAPEVFAFAMRALGERGAAEDLVQEVFTQVWRHASSYDPDRATVRTWLYGIARNAIIDAHRRTAARPVIGHDSGMLDTHGVPDSIERAMLGWQVASALERLTPEHREIVRLAHVRGLSMREIAERTGLPLGTVKSRAWYALRALRLALEEMGIR